ncbi:hypothetical protein F0L74_09925 [Chitinophaga agrisoli]|uniref:Uncharacterized protein n=1 Tax=Chitinophaga agrisoli TaxID=2607653 RepID=A0A5B2VX46_9BACT|nr:hypothetical protein [Chitinophaga agrisoli]KAA2242837.1 hypothetical protein F0L74_09925 [Chitinophaga agrisoli]
MSEYKVGGKVIAIQDHSCGRFKKGKVYPILGLKSAPCCQMPLIDIGIPQTRSGMECTACGGFYGDNDQNMWFQRKAFVPLDQIESPQVTYTKIIEQLPVGAN